LMPALKAIQTRYDGYFFRSRLEARWYVFFDTLDIDCRYESEGYQLGLGLFYLPDFWLPELRTHISIKPVWPFDESEAMKAGALAAQSQQLVLVLAGEVGPLCPACAFWRNDEGKPVYDGPVYLAECPVCSHLSVANERYLQCLFCEKQQELPPAIKGPFSTLRCTPRMHAAYAAARSARFEHGEIG